MSVPCIWRIWPNVSSYSSASLDPMRYTCPYLLYTTDTNAYTQTSPCICGKQFVTEWFERILIYYVWIAYPVFEDPRKRLELYSSAWCEEMCIHGRLCLFSTVWSVWTFEHSPHSNHSEFKNQVHDSNPINIHMRDLLTNFLNKHKIEYFQDFQDTTSIVNKHTQTCLPSACSIP